MSRCYVPGHWSRFYEGEELVSLFVAEIEEGMDEYDYSGPVLRRSESRAGIMKVASSRDRLTSRERELFRVAAEVQKRTGCPIMTHLDEGTAGEEQIFLFQQEGVRLDRVMLCHADRKPDVGYHRALLSAGVTLEYDSAFRWEKQGRKDNPTLELLGLLLPEYPGQLVLGMDAARPAYWSSYGGGPGLEYLWKVFREKMLEQGLTGKQVQALFVENPARVLTFVR
ncbi:MAG: hypothetical protein HC904_09600 [Blastochloris sp.]|nr:hypothetical protein [Blastochloris sp.]